MMNENKANNPRTPISPVRPTYGSWWKLQPTTIVIAVAVVANLGIRASTSEATVFALGAGLIALVALVHQLNVKDFRKAAATDDR